MNYWTKKCGCRLTDLNDEGVEVWFCITHSGQTFVDFLADIAIEAGVAQRQRQET